MGTLYVSDLDGTLLGPDAKVSARSACLLNRAIAGGAMFTVATARTPATVQPLLASVHTALPAVVLTGAALWHFDTQRYSDVRYIDRSYVDALESMFATSGVVPFVYTLMPDDTEHILRVYYNSTKPSAADRKFMEERRNLPLKRFCVGATVPENRRNGVVLYYGSGSYDSVCRVAELISSATDCSVSVYEDIYNPGIGLIEVFAPGVSKASAVRALADRVGADRLVVFGDNLNDLAMFEVADCSVAVENALQSVRNAASEVIGPNTDDSVAQYIAADFFK